MLHALDDLSAGAGDDTLDLLAAVCQCLGGGLGGDLGPVHEGRLGRGDRGNHITDGFDALRDLLCAICRCSGDGLNVREDPVHHLTAGFGDGLLLLFRAVFQGLMDRFGGTGDPVLNLRAGGGNGVHYLRCSLFGGRTGLFRGRRNSTGRLLGGLLCSFGLLLQFCPALGVDALPGLGCLVPCLPVSFGSGRCSLCILVCFVVIVAGKAGITILPEEAVQLVTELVQPSDGRPNGALGDIGDELKYPTHEVAEGLACLVSSHKGRCKSSHHRDGDSDRVCFHHGIECRLSNSQTGRPAFGSFMGGSKGSSRSCLYHRSGRGGGQVTFVGQKCSTDKGDNGDDPTNGVFQFGQLLVILRDGDHQLVGLDDEVAESREQAVSQFAGQGSHVVLQGRQPPAEGLAGFQHTVVELPALTGGGFHSGLQFLKAHLAVRDALVQVGHAFTSGLADLIERVEARVDHHVHVFQRDLLGAGHLAIGPDKGLHLVRVAQRDIAQHLQHVGGVVCRNAELQQGLGALSQIRQFEGCGCRHFADLFQLFGGKLFVTQHDLEIGEVALHVPVVGQTALHHAQQGIGGFLSEIGDHLPGGYRPFIDALLCRVAVQPDITRNTEISHWGRSPPHHRHA